MLWYDKTLMDKFGYQVPTTWQQWAAIGARVATEHPGYIIGNTGDSYSAWTYLWADKCPLSQVQKDGSVRINSTDSHCTRMASLLDPLIKNGTAPPENIFTPAFAQKYGGADPKVLMMPGPTWYAKDVFSGTLKIPAGHMAAAMPLRWNGETPITTGQIGGGPWIISRHSKNIAAAGDFVTWVTTSPIVKDKGARLPLLRARGHALAREPRQGSVLRRKPGKAAPGSRQPDLEGLEHGHLPGPAGLVEHRRHAARGRQVADLPPPGARRRARTGRAGGRLQGRQAMTA